MKPLSVMLIAFLATLAMPINAGQYSEKDFKRCVQLKDLTLLIGKRADEGVSRKEMLSKSQKEVFSNIIEQVYDFHGVLSNQQMARQQFDLCLKYITKK
jgi:hypothetical protein